jgi:sugar phosphate permease
MTKKTDTIIDTIEVGIENRLLETNAGAHDGKPELSAGPMGDVSRIRHAKSTWRRWTIAGLLVMTIIVNYLDRGNLSIAMPTIRHDLSLDDQQMGLVLSAFQWTYAIAIVPMGLVVDRIGPRRAVIAAGLAWTLCAAATGLARNLTGLVLFRACLGLAEAPTFPAAIKVVDSWFPNREKALSVAMYEVAVQVGSAGAPLLGALLISRLSWRFMFVTMGLLSLVPLLIWFLRYRQPEDDPLLEPEERRLIMSGRTNERTEATSFAEWRSLFRHRQTWTMIAGGLSFSGMYGFYLWLPIYLQQTRHFSLLRAGGSMSLLGLAGITGVVTGAFLSDLLIRRGFDVLVARCAVIAGAALLGATTIAGAAVFHSNLALLAAIAIDMFACSMISAPWWALVPVVSPSARLVASLGSLQNGGSFLGAAISPLAIGWLLDHGFDFKAVLALSAGFALSTAVIYGAVLRNPIKNATG